MVMDKIVGDLLEVASTDYETRARLKVLFALAVLVPERVDYVKKRLQELHSSHA